MKILINISVITQIYRGMGIFTKLIIKELIENNESNYKYIFVSGNKLDQETFQLIIGRKLQALPHKVCPKWEGNPN